jgi:hypothetical protein
MVTLGHKLVIGKQDWLPTLWTNGKGGSRQAIQPGGLRGALRFCDRAGFVVWWRDRFMAVGCGSGRRPIEGTGSMRRHLKFKSLLMLLALFGSLLPPLAVIAPAEAQTRASGARGGNHGNIRGGQRSRVHQSHRSNRSHRGSQGVRSSGRHHVHRPAHVRRHRPAHVRHHRPGRVVVVHPRRTWNPGGAIAAGAALGFIAGAAAVSLAGNPPRAGYCWFYTSPNRTTGFWDRCPR